MRVAGKEADLVKLSQARAKVMLQDLDKSNPKAAALTRDQSPHSSALSSRRGGKTYSAVATALITGEAKPGAIALILSLNKKQLKRLYWDGAPSGIHRLARKYDLGLEYNSTDLKWIHQNGSHGYLLGLDDDDQLEVVRGLEADLYVIDECKSIPPLLLDKLIREIIEPQRLSRNGRIILTGTPGDVFAGPFWQATDPSARDSNGRVYSVGVAADYSPAPRVDAEGRTPEKDLLWSAHYWSMADNGAMPHQWEGALRLKAANSIKDEDPTWQIEYLGRWAKGGVTGLVYNYGEQRSLVRCAWMPQRTNDNPSGLPAEGAPWVYLAGVDLGFEAPTAVVVGAYSRVLKQLRQVYEVGRPKMLPREVGELLSSLQDTYGRFERIYVDAGNLGKMVLAGLESDYGLPVEAAKKNEKYDHIAIYNDAVAAGEVQILEGSKLEEQQLTDKWKLRDQSPEGLLVAAKAGKLVEDDAIPNDFCDAWLYLYRGSMHMFASPSAPPSDLKVPGMLPWVKPLFRSKRSEVPNGITAPQRYLSHRLIIAGASWS